MSEPAPLPPLHRFSHAAMNTLFEIWIAGEEPEYARQAATAAFSEIDRLEERLSRFIENSEVRRIGRQSGAGAAAVSHQTFECLRAAQMVSQVTGGAFDVTLGPLLALWRPEGSGGPVREPGPEELEAARARTGMGLLKLDEASGTAELGAAGAQLDLGAIGKGYAIDQGAALLREWGIAAALLHGGDSSVYGLGAPEGSAGWPVGVGAGAEQEESEGGAGRQLMLRGLALGASGTAHLGEHILDPRTGRPPVGGPVRAWATNPSAAVADALSTAFMVMSPEEVAACCAQFADVGAQLLVEHAGRRELLRYGAFISG